ncbi:MAG: sugar phosphate isomerase/epimerase [Planctomycetes bacterium]|nr:sugar phosphate isomerase/epimerase [Planctomycetota bacterium]
MKVGINLLLWTCFVEEKHFPLFKQLKDAGYDGVEVPLVIGDELHYERVAQAIKNEGLEVTAVCSGTLDKNIISPDAAIRQAGGDHIKKAIDCAQALGAKMIGGPMYAPPGYFTGEAPTEEEKQWAIENLSTAAEYAQTAGIHLALEFLNRFEVYLCNTVAQTKEIVDAVGNPHLGIHYDTHHVHYEEDSIAEAILRGGSSITHVHYSENNRGNLGSGQVDWQTTTQSLKEIGYDGWITIEAFNQKVDGLRQAVHIWRPFFESEEECYQAGIQLVRDHWS